MRIIQLTDQIVTCIKTGISEEYLLQPNEFISEIGELGQRMLQDGTFEDVPQPIVETTPSIQEEILFESKYQTLLLEMTMLGVI